MNIKHPQNFKEALVSALPNCTTMMLGMMTLNMWIYGHLTLENWLTAIPGIFVTAFVLDFFFVGPMVLRIVNKYNIQKYMPLIRVGMMAGILTFVAPIVESGAVVSLNHYLMALPRNYIVALFLQVFVAYPLGMRVLEKYRNIAIAK